ncbi:MAG: protein kinase [Anaerolineales bacterium]|nr:protein kinase [Anaerolineales bacterium]
MSLSGKTPQTIGRYEIKQLLGRGGMASVYLAHDPHFERDVAIKILPREFLHDPQFLTRFRREAKTIASLDHPAIVPVYDYGEDDGQPFLVMRYMAGGSLSEHLHLRPISLAEAITITRRVASALDEAHQKGLVHRDLKPGNVLFDQRSDAFLSDFGIVKITEATASFTGTGVIGTPAYMSPEQVHGDQEMDGRSDIYTLGIMLYQMLTGELPYKADTPAKQMMAHILDPIPDIKQKRPDLPPGFNQVLSKAMAKKPDERFNTASLMVDELETITNPGLSTPAAFSISTGSPPAAGTASPSAADDPTQTIVYDTDQPTRVSVPAAEPEEAAAAAQPPPRPRWLWAAGALGLIALIALAVWLIRGSQGGTATATLTPTTNILVAMATEEPTETVTAEPLATSTVEEIAAVVQPTDTVPPPTNTIAPTPTTAPTAVPEATPTETEETAATLVAPEGEFEIGRSAGGIPITAIRIGEGPKNIVLVGGLHAGFAPATVSLTLDIVKELQDNPELVPTNASIYIITNANPDSPYDPGELRGRLNANGVDLNRNWDCEWEPTAIWKETVVSAGSAPFSEPETIALRDFLLALDPVAVVFWHSSAPGVFPAGCGELYQPSVDLARLYARSSGGYDYVSSFSAYYVTGDAADWLATQGIPAITIETRNHINIDWEFNLGGMTGVLEQYR